MRSLAAHPNWPVKAWWQVNLDPNEKKRGNGRFRKISPVFFVPAFFRKNTDPYFKQSGIPWTAAQPIPKQSRIAWSPFGWAERTAWKVLRHRNRAERHLRTRSLYCRIQDCHAVGGRSVLWIGQRVKEWPPRSSLARRCSFPSWLRDIVWKMGRFMV